jgi:2-dehydropantoate 2-reductase
VFQIQLEKLAVNAFRNPVCALHGSKNSFLSEFPELPQATITEIASIVLQLPEHKGWME